jgi:hypothetical protein
VALTHPVRAALVERFDTDKVVRCLSRSMTRKSREMR